MFCKSYIIFSAKRQQYSHHLQYGAGFYTWTKKRAAPLMIQTSASAHTRRKSPTSMSSLFFSDRGIGAVMSLVKRRVVRWRPQKAHCDSPAVSQSFPWEEARYPALPARLPAALHSPFIWNEWFLSGQRLQCETASKEVRQKRTMNSAYPLQH